MLKLSLNNIVLKSSHSSPHFPWDSQQLTRSHVWWMVNRWLLANDLATVVLITTNGGCTQSLLLLPVPVVARFCSLIAKPRHIATFRGVSQFLKTTLSVGALCWWSTVIVGVNPVWTLVLRAGADCVAVDTVSLKYCVGTVKLEPERSVCASLDISWYSCLEQEWIVKTNLVIGYYYCCYWCGITVLLTRQATNTG